jgi:nucleotide-binding universal stress UspA family protein
VVVGIDGSRVAVRAALWAVDEAVHRDIPLRLICAIAPDGSGQFDSQNEARKLAAAEVAVRYALMAVESLEKPVKIEVEIVQGPSTRTLIDASRAAAMICVGATGITHFAPGRVGSTAETLASSAQCPVAIIRGPDCPARDAPGTILVYVGTHPDVGAVLRVAVEQALLRRMPLRAVTAWQSRQGDVHDSAVVAKGNRQVHAQLDRRLESWVHRYPDLEVSSLAVHGSLGSDLAEYADSIQLVVVGSQDQRGAAELVGPSGNASLQPADCSMLIVSSQHL